MFDVRHILAPTDLSESGIPALRYARLFAEKFGARLTVMYSDPIVYPVDLVGPSPSLFVAPTPAEEEKLRREVASHVGNVLGDCPRDIIVAVGQPVATVLRAVTDYAADMIVIGTHARHGWRRAILGSVSEGVLHGSRVPVLTVSSRDRVEGGYGITKIVCAVNFTDVARDALRAAVRFAEVFGAQLVIVHVIEPEETTDSSADEERVRLWIAPEMQSSCSYRELVLRGGPAERVLDCADDLGADLLVTGAQHKLFRDATVIGTTTERLIRFASCPVLVVPRPLEAAVHETVSTVSAAATSPTQIEDCAGDALVSGK